MTTKKCSKCEEVKPLAEYHKDKSSKDGLCYSCKTCTNKRNRKSDGQRKDQRRKQDQTRQDIIKKQHAKWYKNNKDKVLNRNKILKRHYRKVSHDYRLRECLASRMRTAMNGNCKADTTKALLGCTYEEARAHIEAQFTQGMSWDKMGVHGIHIDHIRPCASFDLSDPEQQRECFHYTNLQPLWAEDNLAKSDKWKKAPPYHH